MTVEKCWVLGVCSGVRCVERVGRDRSRGRGEGKLWGKGYEYISDALQQKQGTSRTGLF